MTQGFVLLTTAAAAGSGCGGTTDLTGHGDAHGEPGPDAGLDETSDTNVDPAPDTWIDPAPDMIPDPAMAHWIMRTRTDDYEQLSSSAVRGDGAIVLSGRRGTSSDDTGAWMVVIKPDGDVAGEVETDVVREGRVTGLRDGGIVLSGSIWNASTGWDAWVAILDESGAFTRQMSIGTSGDEGGPAVAEAGDGALILAAALGPEPEEMDLWIARIGEEAGIEWSIAVEEYGYNGRPYIVGGAHGEVYLLANYSVPGTYEWDNWIMRIDGPGIVTWQKAFGRTGIDRIALGTASGDGVILAGQMEDSSGILRPWIAKMSGDGTFVWQETLVSSWSGAANGILPAAGGDWLVMGQASRPFPLLDDVWMAGVDDDGVVLFVSIIGHDGSDLPWTTVMAGGSPVIGGWTRTEAYSPPPDAYVAKIGADGTFAGDCTYLESAWFESEPTFAAPRDTEAVVRDVDASIQETDVDLTMTDVPFEKLCPL